MSLEHARKGLYHYNDPSAIKVISDRTRKKA